ncbi:MAG: monovalent cation/H(+) antiporter subunit G [Clostridiales bacterium]|nr:monovalent cation/H(+) antiporter subunit G [Clostridiales bacterium]
MSIAVRIIVDVLLACGIFFAFAGTVGILRMPDTFSRMQSSTNIATLGLLGIVVGALVYAICTGQAVMAVKIGIIGAFGIITNPVGSHAICRAAYRAGVRPKNALVCDDYGRDNPHGD